MLKETTNLRNDIQHYTSGKTKNWRELLKLGKTLDLKERSAFLWIWPTEESLTNFQNVLQELKIECILSVGCGSGLFEWILKESIGITVYGLEVDRAWWKSKYSVKSFIELNFIDDFNAYNNAIKPNHFLQQCCHKKSGWDFVLLFCYFNNRDAFLNYLQMYKGNWVILIGPTPEAGIHTDPNPVEPNFPPDTQWQLRKQLTIGNSDIIAIYANF